MRFTTTITSLLFLAPLALATPDHIPGPPHQSSDNRIPSGARPHPNLYYTNTINNITNLYASKNIPLSTQNTTTLYALSQQALYGAPRVSYEELKLASWKSRANTSKGEARVKFSEMVRKIQERIREEELSKRREQKEARLAAERELARVRYEREREAERKRREEEKRRMEEKRKEMMGWWRDEVEGRRDEGDVKSAEMLLLSNLLKGLY